MKKLATVFVSGLVVLGFSVAASADARSDYLGTPELSAPPMVGASAARVDLLRTQWENFGNNGGTGTAGDNPFCFYDSGPFNPALASPASQCDTSYPFDAAAADDFILADPVGGQCIIHAVQTCAVRFGANFSTPADWNGVAVTIYTDNGLPPGGPNGQTKGPDGAPGPPPDCIHGGPGLVYSIFHPAGGFGFIPTADPDAYLIQILTPDLILEKNVKYWIEIMPHRWPPVRKA